MSNFEKLYERVNLSGPVSQRHGTACWEWKGALNKDGYGTFWNGETTRLAHRESYELMREKIPFGLVIDHECRNRACVNPKHLRVVTRAINSSENRINLAPAHCKKGHEFSERNSYIQGKGSKVCRLCQSDYDKAYRAKKAAKRQEVAA